MCGFPIQGNFGSGNGLLMSDYKGLFSVRFHHMNKSQKRNHTGVQQITVTMYVMPVNQRKLLQYLLCHVRFVWPCSLSKPQLTVSCLMLLENHL